MNSAFGHARFRGPLALLRSGVSDIWRTAFAVSRRYQPISSAEQDSVECGDVGFHGDIPIHAGDALKQSRRRFTLERPQIEEVKNLVFTPSGAGWKDGVLIEKFSASRPGLRALLSRPAPRQTIAEAYVIQSEHTDTFGDWMSEYLAPLSRLGEVTKPVLLPASMASRTYVKRDAARLGIQFISATKPILIEKATVIRQSKYIRYWTKPEVSALRELLHVMPSAPMPGSIVYLSRHGEASEVAARSHPHAVIEKVVRAAGGLVLRTAEVGLDDYLAAASSAETVVFDHGSAGYNMIYWRPKRVVELVSDAWWMNAFLFFADALGVNDYTIIRSDLGGKKRVESQLKDALATPIRDAS